MKNIYFRRLLMNKSNFKIINNMMNNIYKIKIDYFKQFKQVKFN